MRNVKQVSRRDFLKGTLAAGVSLAAAGLAGCAAEAPSSDVTQSESVYPEGTSSEAMQAGAEGPADAVTYDQEYDVVVIGMGFAGCSAAIEAAKTGASVLILEKAPEMAAGGNSRVCGQQILDPTDAERAIAYFERISEGFDYDADLLRATVTEMCENGNWLKDTIDPDMDLQPLMYPEFPDVEDSDTMRCWLIDGERSVGKLLNLLLGKIAEMSNIIISYESPARELLQDKTTRVITGVTAVIDGNDVNIKAAHGVVMACGGYENNMKMIQNYYHLPYAYAKGSLYNNGDGIIMAAKVAADLWHLNNPAGPDLNFKDPESSTYFGYTLAMTLGSRTAVYVGPDGTRFIDEATMTKHGKLYCHGRYQTAATVLPAYAVFDEAAFTAGPIYTSAWSADNTAEVEKGWIKKADSLEELAAIIQVPAENLAKTIRRFNFYCEQGEDFEFNRPAATLNPISESGPYYAMELSPTLTNTQGGAVRNADCQVMDVDGNAIPHLYSAGEFGSMYVHGYNGGGNVGEALATGRIAGRNAVAG